MAVPGTVVVNIVANDGNAVNKMHSTKIAKRTNVRDKLADEIFDSKSNCAPATVN